jgi:hypothetical protein
MFRIILIFLCIASSAFGEPAEYKLSITKFSPVPPDVAQFNGVPLTIDKSVMPHIPFGKQIRVMNFPISQNRNVDLDLQRFNVFTSDAQVVIGSIDTNNQLTDRPVELPDVVLLRGSIIDEPGSKVFIAIGEYTTNGIIESGGSTFVIAKNPAEGWTAVYELDAVDPELMNWVDVQCGVEHYEGLVKQSTDEKVSERSLGESCAAIRMAIETDWEFTNLFGGNIEASSEYAATLIGAMSTIYESDVNMAIKICYLRLWASAFDPWTTGSSGDRLGEFHSHWQTNMQHVFRHLAHMVSGAGLGGGVAYVGAVCSGYGYAVSGNINGSFPLPIEDHNGNNWDLMVVAHETGHNCGTWHTHDYSPPIDGCGLGDCTDAWGGTIMSYCHTCSGGLSNMVMTFHPLVQDTIIAYLADGISCSLGGFGQPPNACLDMVWKMPEESIDIDVLANDYVNDCSFVQIVDYDTSTKFGGTIEMIGGDPTNAVLRYTPPEIEHSVDVFLYYIEDAGGQSSTGHVTIFTELPRPADTPANVEPGASTNYYALDSLSSLPNFDLLDPIGQEVVSQVNFPSTGGNFAGSGLSDDIGAVFEGYVDIPESNTYVLYVDSDDGSKLYIGGELLIDNDGLHGMVEEAGQIALAPGLHEIRVEFFERGGGAGCIVSLSSDTLLKQVIPESMWWHHVVIYGDINDDGSVDVLDLLELIAAWGSCDLLPPGEGNDDCDPDLNGDGNVDVEDLLELIAQWS